MLKSDIIDILSGYKQIEVFLFLWQLTVFLYGKETTKINIIGIIFTTCTV